MKRKNVKKYNFFDSVPIYWEKCRMKYLIDGHFSGVWGEEIKDDNNFLCLRIADFNFENQTINNDDLTYRNYNINKVHDRVLKNGDILLEKSGGGEKYPVGRTVNITTDIINNKIVLFSNFCECIRPNKIESKFLAYLLKALYQNTDMCMYYNQTTGLQNIDLKRYMDIVIPYPERKKQRQIVSLLDRKVLLIDNLIKNDKNNISRLKQYKQTLITETVTKGLNKKVKLKNCGLRDINKIPSEWHVSKIKYVFSGNKGLSITKEDLIDNGLPVLSYGQIHSKINTGVGIKEDLIRYVDCKFEKGNLNSLVKKNDFVFADTSEDYEGCGNCCYKRDDSKLYAGYHTIVLHSKMNEDNRYFAYLFKTDIWRKQIRELADGIKVYSITQKILMNASVIVPPLKEQKEIADFLDKKCPAIDKLIELKEKKIELLNKYKKSLIYECVTGKRKVNG